MQNINKEPGLQSPLDRTWMQAIKNVRIFCEWTEGLSSQLPFSMHELNSTLHLIIKKIDEKEPTAGEVHTRLYVAAQNLRAAVKDKLPLGFYALFDEECADLDKALSKQTSHDK